MTRDLRVTDCAYDVLEEVMSANKIRFCRENFNSGMRYICRITDPVKETVEGREILERLSSETITNDLIVELI